MAQPTTPHPQPPPQQAPSPGVGQTPGSMRPASAGAMQFPDTPGAKPVLFEEIDPVLLVRLYPGAIQTGDAKGLALEAGKADFEAGKTLIADQQEPVEGTPAAKRLETADAASQARVERGEETPADQHARHAGPPR